MQSSFQKLRDTVIKGIQGKNEGIPLGIERVSNYISIRKNTYTLLGGNSGTGKTAIVDALWVLEPYDWYLKNKDKTHLKIEWVYRSMERSKIHKLAKWACYKIWKDNGELITPAELLGWKEGKKLTEQQLHMFNCTEEYFETMEDSKIITIIEGQENPRGIYKQLEEYALQRGHIEKINEFESIYHPNNSDLIVVPVIDHAGKCKLETVDGVKNRKGTTDKLSEYMSICRDRFNMSPVVISQFNRSIKSEIFNKQEDPEPTAESFKDSGNLYEDCDIALSLFNPFKFKVYDHMKYEIPKFVNPKTGANYFRSLKLLKSSFSEDDVRWGLGFLGHVGKWAALPKASEMDESIYQGIVTHQYFLE
jgi:hypothetical protein